MSKEQAIPALCFWSIQMLDAAIRAKTMFVIPSGMGGSFIANLIGHDHDAGTGRFRINHPQAGDFHGTETIEDLAKVERAIGPLPAFPKP